MEIAADMEPLRIFYNMSELTRPGLSNAWRCGVAEPDVTFRDPTGDPA